MNLHVIQTGSKGNCYLLEESGHFLMLDAGVRKDAIYKAVNYNLAALDGCLVTHNHRDHSLSVDFILKNRIPLYVGTENNLRSIGGNWVVKSFPVDHDVEEVGFLIHNTVTAEVVCYITDTGFVRANPVGVTHLIVECNFLNETLDANKEALGDRYLRIKQSHMSLDRVLSFLKKMDKSKLQTIILVHLSDLNSDESRMIKKVANLTGVLVYAAHNNDVISLGVNGLPF